MLEQELKAVIADPELARTRLLAAGAVPGFRGLMVDHRYDREGDLLARDEVLRLRELRGPAGSTFRLSWKGPVSRSPEGYKSRSELEYELLPRNADPGALLERLGFREVHRIDRYVEYYGLGGAELRLEWYPRMDVLMEVEGDPAAIERALPVVGLPREDWQSDPLPSFAARYEARTGVPAAFTLEALGNTAPPWPR